MTKTYGQATPTAGKVNVYFTPVVPSTSDCADETQPYVYTVMDYPATGTGWGTRPSTYTAYVSQTSSSFDPGLPYGKFTVCIQDATTTNRIWKPTAASGLQTYDNTANTPHALIKYDTTPASTWTTGSC